MMDFQKHPPQPQQYHRPSALFVAPHDPRVVPAPPPRPYGPPHPAVYDPFPRRETIYSFPSSSSSPSPVTAAAYVHSSLRADSNAYHASSANHGSVKKHNLDKVGMKDRNHQVYYNQRHSLAYPEGRIFYFSLVCFLSSSVFCLFVIFFDMFSFLCDRRDYWSLSGSCHILGLSYLSRRDVSIHPSMSSISIVSISQSVSQRLTERNNISLFPFHPLDYFLLPLICHHQPIRARGARSTAQATARER
ncbi:hypothetical protein AWENTII_005516 [Aspergillus wentii]